MLDKTLIKKNFKKSITTYTDNAIIQKATAKKLVSLIKKRDYENILEIGSYSGILTKIINDNFSFENYFAIDIVDDSELFLNKINPEIKFINSDVESFSTDIKFDLIIANASLQWCDDFKNVILKLKTFLKKDGFLALTIFQENNLFEIKESFNLSLNYPRDEEIKNIFSKNAMILNDEISLQFKTPLEALRHLKLTGVNSIRENNFSYSEIKRRMDILDKKFNNNLTYKPLYIID